MNEKSEVVRHESPAPVPVGRKLQPGDIIYSKLPVPINNSMLSGRMFAVKSVDKIGNLVVLPLSTAAEMTQYACAVAVQPDKENWLRKESVLVADTEVELSGSWPVVQQPGNLGKETMHAVFVAQERYREKAEVQRIQADKPLQKDERDVREKIADLYDGFKRDPATYVDYLKFSGNFYRYSARNNLLIYMQNRYSTFVASKAHWQQLGYSIRTEHERRSMEIYRPVEQKFFNRDGTLMQLRSATPHEKQLIASGQLPLVTKQYYAPTPVWDIAQTTCPAGDYPKIYDKGHADVAHRALYDAVKQLAELEGIPVSTTDMKSISLNGYYVPADNTIFINNNLNETKAAATLCHEYAHALLHNTSAEEVPHAVREFEAQSLAVVLMSSYGLRLDENETAYMVDYLNDAQKESFDFNTSVQRVSKQMRHVEERLSDILVQAPGMEQLQQMEQQVQQNLMQEV